MGLSISDRMCGVKWNLIRLVLATLVFQFAWCCQTIGADQSNRIQIVNDNKENVPDENVWVLLYAAEKLQASNIQGVQNASFPVANVWDKANHPEIPAENTATEFYVVFKIESSMVNDALPGTPFPIQFTSGKCMEPDKNGVAKIYVVKELVRNAFTPSSQPSGGTTVYLPCKLTLQGTAPKHIPQENDGVQFGGYSQKLSTFNKSGKTVVSPYTGQTRDIYEFQVGAITSGNIFLSRDTGHIGAFDTGSGQLTYLLAAPTIGVDTANPDDTNTQCYQMMEMSTDANNYYIDTTMIDYYSFPQQVEGVDSDGNQLPRQLRTFYLSDDTIRNRLQSKYYLKPLTTTNNNFVRFMGPAHSPADFPSFTQYLDEMVAKMSELEKTDSAATLFTIQSSTKDEGYAVGQTLFGVPDKKYTANYKYGVKIKKAVVATDGYDGYQFNLTPVGGTTDNNATSPANVKTAVDQFVVTLNLPNDKINDTVYGAPLTYGKTNAFILTPIKGSTQTAPSLSDYSSKWGTDSTLADNISSSVTSDSDLNSPTLFFDSTFTAQGMYPPMQVQFTDSSKYDPEWHVVAVFGEGNGAFTLQTPLTFTSGGTTKNVTPAPNDKYLLKLDSDTVLTQFYTNSVYSNAIADVISGLDLGFIDSPNAGTEGVRWYAKFPQIFPFTFARTWKNHPDDGFYDPWAAFFYHASDSYAFPFSDRYYPSALLSYPLVQTGGSAAGNNQLRITLLPQNMLDAPTLTFEESDKSDSTVKVSWPPVGDAADSISYTMTINPPLPKGSISINGANATLTNLAKGYPYVVETTAWKGDNQRSNAIPYVYDTKETPDSDYLSFTPGSYNLPLAIQFTWTGFASNTTPELDVYCNTQNVFTYSNPSGTSGSPVNFYGKDGANTFLFQMVKHGVPYNPENVVYSTFFTIDLSSLKSGQPGAVKDDVSQNTTTTFKSNLTPQAYDYYKLTFDDTATYGEGPFTIIPQQAPTDPVVITLTSPLKQVPAKNASFKITERRFKGYQVTSATSATQFTSNQIKTLADEPLSVKFDDTAAYGDEQFTIKRFDISTGLIVLDKALKKTPAANAEFSIVTKYPPASFQYSNAPTLFNNDEAALGTSKGVDPTGGGFNINTDIPVTYPATPPPTTSWQITVNCNPLPRKLFENTIKFLTTLTTQVLPSDAAGSVSASPNPPYELSDKVEITATSKDTSKYNFIGWTASGGATIGDLSKSATTVTLNDHSNTVIANFEETDPTDSEKTLTMKISPSSLKAESVNPSVGVHTFKLGKTSKSYTTTISAIPEVAGNNYQFVEWDTPDSKIANINNASSPSSQIILTDSATVTAKFKALTATLTGLVSPSNTGSIVQPVGGSKTVNPGETVTIQAQPIGDYTFDHWTLEAGGAFKSGSTFTSNPAEVVVSNDLYATAYFAKSDTAPLTMAVSPASSGTTNPSSTNNPHYVQIGNAVSLTATAADKTKYAFSKWKVTKGTATLANAASPTNATVTLTKPTTGSASATVEADFVAVVTSASLTVAVSPDSLPSTTTTPNVGTASTYHVGESVDLVAHETENYSFVKWSVTSGDGVLANSASASTTVTLKSADVTVTATYKKKEVPVTLTMKVSPDNSGYTDPAAGGSYTVYAGIPVVIAAAPVKSPDYTYTFSHWKIEGNGHIDNPELAVTAATLQADATITALFTKVDKHCDLTMAVKSDDGASDPGSVNPTTGAPVKHAVGSSIAITATPFEDPTTEYYFNGWTLSDPSLAIVADPQEESTILTFYKNGSLTVTANFKKVIAKGVLAMTVSSTDGASNPGTTSPAIGDHSVAIGKTQAVTATPSDDYLFDKWGYAGNITFVEGSVSPAGVASAKATLLFKDDGSAGRGAVVAIFKKKEVPATLTVQVNNAAYGHTNPGASTVPYSYHVGSKVTLTAYPNTGYTFSDWSLSGNASFLTDKNLATATIELAGNATITANFAVVVEYCSLTMAVKSDTEPSSPGTTQPQIGADGKFATGKSISITAQASEGYVFSEWTLSDITLATVGDSSSSATSLSFKKSGELTVTANFKTAPPEKGTLTMAVSPDTLPASSTDPSVGETKIPIETLYLVKALSVDGYHFSKWKYTGNIIFKQDTQKPTQGYVTLTKTTDEQPGSATVTAVFEADEIPATLTMAVNNASYGNTNPAASSKAYNYHVGAKITIQAYPNSGYKFDHWQVTGSSTINSTKLPDAVVTLAGDATVTAYFSKVEQYSQLTMKVDGDGTTKPQASDNAYQYPLGATISIEATPASGYHFTSWDVVGGTLAGKSAETTVTLNDATVSVTAHFAQDVETASLTMAVSPEAGGCTSPAANSVPYQYHVGESVSISATANDDYHFIKWALSGNIKLLESGANGEATVKLLGASATATAVFEKKETPIYLTMAVSPANTGSTNPSVGTNPYKHYVGDTVDITATPADGYHFSIWQLSGGNGVLENAKSVDTSVTMKSSVTVTAVFEQNTVAATLTMVVSPSDAGHTNPGVNSTPRNYIGGETISVQATANSGYHFSHWMISGNASIKDIKDADTLLTFEGGDVTLTAYFAKSETPASLTIAVSDSAGGHTDPGASSTPYTNYYVGERVKLTATPFSGYHFSHWSVSGGGILDSDTAPVTYVLLQGDATVTAYFEANAAEALLTMQVNPIGAGHTNPASSETAYKYSVGDKIDISATANSGYFFNGWAISGGGEILDPSSAETYVELTGDDATVTANFEKSETTATLTMAVATDGTGTTLPTLGAHTYNVGESVKITAVPTSGYYFNGWKVSGNGNLKSSTTNPSYMTLNGTATVIATFAKQETSATLMMVVSPDSDAGSTSPGASDTPRSGYFVGESGSIKATPKEGWQFAGWSTENAYIKSSERLDPQTTATITGTAAVITATFVKAEIPAVLTMKVTPEGDGSTSPGASTTSKPVTHSGYYVNGIVKIKAEPISGFHFTGWLADGATVTDKNSADTTATISGTEPIITATFAEDDDAITLTMAVTPDGAGTTSPGLGEHLVDIGNAFSIETTAESGYYFAGWIIDGKGEISDISEASTTAILQEASTITAVFSDKPVTQVAEGSVVSLNVSDVSSELETFTANPKMEVGFIEETETKRGRSKTKELTARLPLITKVNKKHPSENVDALWNKAISLHNHKVTGVYSKSIKELLLETPIVGKLSDSFQVKIKELDKKNRIDVAKSVYFLPPIITSVTGDYALPGDIFTVHGRFFGSDEPKIYLEVTFTQNNGEEEQTEERKYTLKKCNLLKEDADGEPTIKFMDAKGKENKSCMKVYADDIVYPNDPREVGYSEVTVEYPKLRVKETFTGYIVIINKVGMVVFKP